VCANRIVLLLYEPRRSHACGKAENHIIFFMYVTVGHVPERRQQTTCFFIYVAVRGHVPVAWQQTTCACGKATNPIISIMYVAVGG
jgi:hypothetical protein